MYTVGQKIMHSTNGVCTVSEICHSPFDKRDAGEYYMLIPFFGSGKAKIYIPVNGECSNIRELISKDEAEDIIAKIPQIELISVDIEKNRREIYRKTASENKPLCHVALIKTIRRRYFDFTALRKRLTDTDIFFDRQAKSCLFGELAAVLDKPYEEIEQVVNDLIEHSV